MNFIGLTIKEKTIDGEKIMFFDSEP
jgi:hypothetical protein